MLNKYFKKVSNNEHVFYLNMNNVCIYVFLVLLILIYFFLQILSADCDTCIVIEIVGLLNIKIAYYRTADMMLHMKRKVSNEKCTAFRLLCNLFVGRHSLYDFAFRQAKSYNE
jgi:amino acid transporter